jgi:chlorobactene glucosyltransferase
VVVDDHSSDGTLEIATLFAGRHPQLRVVRSPPLPPRWVGKAHACWVGAQAAGAETQWLCFIDADVWGEPDLVASAVAAVSAERLDLLSLAPRQQLGSFAERLVMPCGLYLLAFYQDLRVVQARDGLEATATGQFILVRRSFYDAIGGHAAVRGAICEDLMLARLLKRAGGYALLQDGRRVLSTRMYSGWSTLWIGISKNLSDMLGGPARTIVIALAAVVLTWAALLIPLADAVSCARHYQIACVALIPAILGSAAAFGLHIGGAAYFSVPPWYGLLFPLGYSVGAAMAIDSVRRRLSGHVSWKGRTYP